MTDGNSIDRRTVLQKIGSVGVLGAAGISVSTVKGEKEHSNVGIDIQSVLELPQVRNVLAVTGHPSPNRAAERSFDTWGQVELYRDDTETKIIDGGDSQIYSIEVPLNVGHVTVVKLGDEFTEEALLQFDSAVPMGVRQRVSNRFDIDWPEGTESTLVGTPDGTDFFRDTTDSESDRLTSVVDGHIETMSAYDTDDGVGYAVLESSEAVHTADRERVNADIRHTRHYVSREFEYIEAENFDPRNGLSVQYSDCASAIAECLTVLLPLPTSCIACAALTAPPAIIACAIAGCGPYALAHSACVYADERNCL